MKAKPLVILASTAFLTGCSMQRQLQKSARQYILNGPALKTAHVGISVFEPARNSYWYNYQGDKYFVPASNTKIPTCYAAMKYLGDSLPGLQVDAYADRVVIFGTGDPTLLHPDFARQPVVDYLLGEKRMIQLGDRSQWRDSAWGAGWSWSDFDADYMPERSVLPLYGNTVRFSGGKGSVSYIPERVVENRNALPTYSNNGAIGYIDRVVRSFRQNNFTLYINGKNRREIEVPFITSPVLAFQLLGDTLHKQIGAYDAPPSVATSEKPVVRIIHSQPTDSMLRLMMHRSDNFYAEQSLLMVSNLRLGFMNDASIIDTLLKTDLKDLPQRPRWADGSGLSRYNLFTPQDFVAILNKMKNEFGMDRVKSIFETGNTGTLANYYVKDSGYLFAKTGSLSGVIALSGFMYTRQNKLILFSVQVNNHQATASQVRRAVEHFIEGIRERY
jgi:D-alanyl-D-alanine carboxypeptidase/D-alanyl-D-alanine-endopeptidase (penicillin-binding protein 4)